MRRSVIVMRKGLISTALLVLSSLASSDPLVPSAGIEGIPGSIAAYAPLTVSAQSAIVMDAATGRVLWEKDADTQRYPASTTKIMTALLLIENCRLDEVITAPPDVETVAESSLHLKPGEQVTARDMLYALMLRSANDAAYSVARHIGGSVEGFAQMMNARARDLGCTNTNFTNPHGLRDEKHMTTARDLALIARAAMTHPEFREVVKTVKYSITRSINKGDELLVSHNKWLLRDATADGIKTGFTIPAGQCYVGSATRNGYRLITVVLKSTDWQADHRQMLDWAFARFERKPLGSAGQITGTARVIGGESEEVAAALENDLYTILPKTSLGQTLQPDIRLGEVKAPVAQGQRVGEIVYRDAAGFEVSAPLVAVSGVKASVPLLAAAGSYKSLIFFGGVCLAGRYVLKRRARRRTSYARLSKTY